jgi:hypothetical protein
MIGRLGSGFHGNRSAKLAAGAADRHCPCGAMTSMSAAISKSLNMTLRRGAERCDAERGDAERSAAMRCGARRCAAGRRVAQCCDERRSAVAVMKSGVQRCDAERSVVPQCAAKRRAVVSCGAMRSAVLRGEASVNHSAAFRFGGENEIAHSKILKAGKSLDVPRATFSMRLRVAIDSELYANSRCTQSTPNFAI